MNKDDINPINTHISLSYYIENEKDKLPEIFSELAEVNINDPFENIVSVISEENPRDCEIGIGKKGGGNPIEADINYIHITSQFLNDGEEIINLHGDFRYEYDNQVESILKQYLDIVGSAEFNLISHNFTVDTAVDEFLINTDSELSDSFNQDIEFTGFRIDYFDERGGKKTDILLQRIEDGDDEGTRVRAAKSLDEVTSSKIENIVEKQKDDMTETIIDIII